MTAVDVVLLVVGILVFVALVFVVIMIPVRRRAHRLRDEMESELGGAGVVDRIENVRTLGLRSLGKTQTRGNGWLALTPTELVFRQLVPDRLTRIPRAAITDVGTEKTWLGKWVGSTLLRVTWRTADGTEDAIAWQVRDLESWLAALGR